MKRFSSISLAVFSILCLLVATEHRAVAFSGYVDPGTGLMALQCAMSVLAAAGYYLRRRIRALFGSKKTEAPTVSAVSDATENPHKVA